MYDVIVIGGGHAGVEAVLSTSKLNCKTLLILGNIEKIAHMPCNPSIGGPAKGILVRELDALGGEMGRCADKTCLQMKMLNSSKGPAVRALRAQSDKIKYPEYMRNLILNSKNITVIEDMVVELIVEDDCVKGVICESLNKYLSKTVIICTGTYMDSSILVGHNLAKQGPDLEKTSSSLSNNLKELGFKLIRLKTGTPPRIKKDSIDYSLCSLETGDKDPYSFSNTVIRPFEKQLPCYLTHTTLKTKQIILDNIEKSSMYGGLVTGVGPRYCPSIEDKIKRFSDKDIHQVFLEPESEYLDEVYIQGFSTSFPKDIQEQMVKSIIGLENALISKYAYAIEYDAIDPTQLHHHLESKKIKSLFFAGQINGTSGYEEAAAQGLMAGINCYLKLHNKEPFVLKRNEAYIGVLIDDLVLKGVKDPYRLLTSRAEFRLLLRHDNSEARLIGYGRSIGLIDEERFQKFNYKQEKIETLKSLLRTIKINPKNDFNEYLKQNSKMVISEKITAFDFLKRPEIDFEDIYYYDQNILKIECDLDIYKEYFEQTLIEVKYAGYIQKEEKEVNKLKQMEERKIPEDINYNLVKNLAKEAIDKLSKIKPKTLGQASRISGVNPNDITMLFIYLERGN